LNLNPNRRRLFLYLSDIILNILISLVMFSMTTLIDDSALFHALSSLPSGLFTVFIGISLFYEYYEFPDDPNLLVI